MRPFNVFDLERIAFWVFIVSLAIGGLVFAHVLYELLDPTSAPVPVSRSEVQESAPEPPLVIPGEERR